jgi:uncharacterized protein YbcI
MAAPISQRHERSVLLEVTNAMVRIYKEQFGRGPTRARSDWAGADTLLCTLEDTLTPAERKLVELGESMRLVETRLFFQHACKEDFRATVEEITGRTVRAFVSGTDPLSDVSSEIFYFIPQNGSDTRLAGRSVSP